MVVPQTIFYYLSILAEPEILIPNFMEKKEAKSGLIKRATLKIANFLFAAAVICVAIVFIVVFYILALIMPRTMEKIGQKIYKKLEIKINNVLRYLPWFLRIRLREFGIMHCRFSWQRRWAYENGLIEFKDLKTVDKNILWAKDNRLKQMLIKDGHIPSIFEFNELLINDNTALVKQLINKVTLQNSYLEKIINKLFINEESFHGWKDVLHLHIRRNGLSANLVSDVVTYKASEPYMDKVKTSFKSMLDEYAAKTMLAESYDKWKEFCDNENNQISAWIQEQMDERQIEIFINSKRELVKKAIWTFVYRRKISKLKVIFKHVNFATKYGEIMLAIKADVELYRVYIATMC